MPTSALFVGETDDFDLFLWQWFELLIAVAGTNDFGSSGSSGHDTSAGAGPGGVGGTTQTIFTLIIVS